MSEWRNLGPRSTGEDRRFGDGRRLQSLGRYGAPGTRSDAAAVRPDPAEIVLARYADGPDLWVTPDVADLLLTGDGGTRGGATLPSTLERFLPSWSDVGAEGLLAAFEAAERALRPHALVRAVVPDDPAPVGPGDLSGGRILVLLHGIFGTPQGTFGALSNESDWAAVASEYGGRVVAFGHPSASVSPLENLQELWRRLPEGAEIDLLCHSRGGLLADLCLLPPLRTEQRRVVEDVFGDDKKLAKARLHDVAEWIEARDARGIKVRQTVRVGTPASGSPFAGRQMRGAASAFQFFVSMCAGPVVGAGVEIVARAAQLASRAQGLDGYSVMDPEGWLVALLRTADRVDTPGVDLLGWTDGGGLWKRLQVLLASAFQGTSQSDLVVPNASMVGGVPRTRHRPVLFRHPDVNHLQYFSHAPLVSELRRTLRPDVTRGGVGAPDGVGKVTAWFVPGIGGSAFVERGREGRLTSRLWPKAPYEALPRELPTSGSPEEHPWAPSSAICELLRRDYDLQVVPWDWRHAPTAGGLKPKPGDVVVTHGHGAWVAALALDALPPDQRPRAVLLAPPAKGEGPEGSPAWVSSSAPPDALRWLSADRTRLVYGTGVADGDGVVTAGDSAAARFVVANHAQLEADDALAAGWIRWLKDGVDLLATRPPPLASRSDAARDDRLNVRVELGFPTDVLTRPLLIGRFENEPLGLMEHSLDRRLHGRLKALLDADAFPGEPFTHHVDPIERVVVFGLGRGDLSEPRLRELVRVACARLFLAHDVRQEVQVVLPDTAARRLAPDVAARAVVEGVLRANRGVPVDRRTSFVTLYAVYEDDAHCVATELVSLEQNPRFGGCAFERTVKKGTGSFGRRPDDRRARAEYDTVRVERDGDHGVRIVTNGRSGATRASNGVLRWDAVSALLARLDEAVSNRQDLLPDLRPLSRLTTTRDLRARLREGRGLAFEVSPEAAAVPWELVLEDDDVPLCIRRPVVRRWDQADDAPTERPEAAGRRVVIVADPEQNLDGARAEGRAVEALFRSGGWPVERLEGDPWQILADLAGGAPRVLHIACHGVARMRPDDPTSPVGLKFGGGVVLARELFDLWDEVPSLVFLNCCYSGSGAAAEQTGPATVLRADFARDLHRFGVRALVVAAWQVRDDDARRFAEVAYDRLLAGRRLGDAVLEARSAIWRPDDLAYGAWQVWGDPDTVLDLVGNPANRLLRPVDRLHSWSDVESELTTLLGLARFQHTQDRPELLVRLDAIASRITREPVVDGAQRGELDRRIAVVYRALGDVREALRWLERASSNAALGAEVTARFHLLDLRSREAFARRHLGDAQRVVDDLTAALGYFGGAAPAEAHSWLVDAQLRAMVTAGCVDRKALSPRSARHDAILRWIELDGSAQAEEHLVCEIQRCDSIQAARESWTREVATAAGGKWEWNADWADLSAEIGRASGWATPNLDVLAAYTPWRRVAVRPSAPRGDADQEWLAIRDRVAHADGDPDEVWRDALAWSERHGEPPDDGVTRVADEASDVKNTLRERWAGITTPETSFPRSLADLVRLVQDAADKKYSVRVVAAGRSMSDVSNPVGTRFVSLARWSAAGADFSLADVAPEAESVLGGPLVARGLYRCAGGRSVESVVRDLRKSDRSPINLGSGSFQGIFGAVTTGTHGSGLGLPPLAATVRAVTLLDLHQGKVRLRRIQPATDGRRALRHAGGTLETLPVVGVDDDATFDAVVMSMGCAGVVIEVVLEVLPETMKVSDHRARTTWDQARAVVKKPGGARHVEVQVNPHAEDSSGGKIVHRAQIVARQVTTARDRGNARPAFWLGRLELAKDVIGWMVKRGLKEPSRFRGTVNDGLDGTSWPDCEGLACDETHHVGELTDILLLNMKYRGVGAEWAVPLAKAEAAADAILAVSRDADERAAKAGGDPAKLAAAYEAGSPLTAVLTLRFASQPKAPFASTGAMGMTAGGGDWCVFEVGMLGAPGAERDEARRDDLYRAYVTGRVQTFRAIDDALVTAVGDRTKVRPHWGLFHAGILDTDRAKDTWGPAFQGFRDLVEGQPQPLFSNAFTHAMFGRSPKAPV